MYQTKKNRCSWCLKDPIYINYHDEEWGVPIFNDQEIFEALVLETFQSGLSWITVLKKREGFRRAFDNFDYKKIAHYSNKKLENLNINSNIIKHKLKISATKDNAIAFIKIQKEFGSFSKYIWRYVNYKPINNKIPNIYSIPKNTSLSKKISSDLKNRGFRFIGSTTIYSYMQAIGMVNDHTIDCFKYTTEKK